MIRSLLIGFLLSVTMALTAPAQSARSPIQQAIAKLDSSKGLCIEFDMTLPGNQYEETIHGTYYALKNKFYIETSELKAWYNGKELWIYLYQNGEINLSHPETEEIIEINPLLELPRIFSEEYNSTVSNTSVGHSILAKPQKKNRKSIEHVIIRGNKKNPIKTIEVKEKGINNKITIQVKSIKQNINITPDTFIYTSDKEPNVKVIDLR